MCLAYLEPPTTPITTSAATLTECLTTYLSEIILYEEHLRICKYIRDYPSIIGANRLTPENIETLKSLENFTTALRHKIL